MRDGLGRLCAVAASGALALTLAACDSGASAVASRDHSAPANLTSEGTSQAFAPAAPAREATADLRTQPVRLVEGKPVWAATRRLSADDAAQANFERNGADFGAKSVEAWVTQAHDFVENPPRGVQHITRSNGDTLFYDAKTNVFAVATKDGAPRTMFKPRDGAAYWEEQKTEGASRVAGASSGSRRSSSDG